MPQLIQFLGTWFGAFCLGLWIPGAIFYGDKYKVIDFKKPWLDVIRDIIATILWPVPFIVDMIKRMNSAANAKKAAEVTGLILFPVFAMAADNQFLDYQLFPALGVLIMIAPLWWLIVLIRTAQGKYPRTWYDEHGRKHIEKGVKRSITYFKAFWWYLGIQVVAIILGIAILSQYKGSL